MLTHHLCDSNLAAAVINMCLSAPPLWYMCIDGFHSIFSLGNWRALYHHAHCWLVNIHITWPFCPPVSMAKDAMEPVYIAKGWCLWALWYCTCDDWSQVLLGSSYADGGLVQSLSPFILDWETSDCLVVLWAPTALASLLSNYDDLAVILHLTVKEETRGNAITRPFM